MNYQQLAESFISQTREYFNRSGRTKAVIGISGGKDSTVCAALLSKALGEKCVHPVSMPLTYQVDPNKEEETPILNEETQKVANTLKLKNTVILPIMDPVQSFFEVLKEIGLNPSKQASINLMPRIRMTMLYYYAQTIGDALVVNTSNLDERLMGYSTIWGDDVGDFAPLQELHVSEVIELGRVLGVPDELLLIPPSDGLTGKTDEQNLGFRYKDVEELVNKFDKGPFMSDATFWFAEESATYDPDKYTPVERKIFDRFRKNSFKYFAVKLIGCEKPKF